MITQKSKILAGDGVSVGGHEARCDAEGCTTTAFMPTKHKTPLEMVPKHFANKGWEVHKDGATICTACQKKRVGRPPLSKIAHHGTQLLQSIVGLPLLTLNVEKVARNIGLPVETVAQLVSKRHHKKYRLTMLPQTEVSTTMIERALKEMAMTFDVTFHSSILDVEVLSQTSKNIVMIRACMVWTVTMDERE